MTSNVSIGPGKQDYDRKSNGREVDQYDDEDDNGHLPPKCTLMRERLFEIVIVFADDQVSDRLLVP